MVLEREEKGKETSVLIAILLILLLFDACISLCWAWCCWDPISDTNMDRNKIDWWLWGQHLTQATDKLNSSGKYLTAIAERLSCSTTHSTYKSKPGVCCMQGWANRTSQYFGDPKNRDFGPRKPIFHSLVGRPALPNLLGFRLSGGWHQYNICFLVARQPQEILGLTPNKTLKWPNLGLLRVVYSPFWLKFQKISVSKCYLYNFLGRPP